MQPLAGNGQFRLLGGQHENLTAQPGELLPDTRRPAVGHLGQILPAGPERLFVLADEAGTLPFEGGDLQLNAPARGCHADDTAADLRQRFELALVGVIQGFPGILRLPEHGLQRDDQRRPEGIARVDQRQHRLANNAGKLWFGVAEIGEPAADLAVQPELVAHDRTPGLVPTCTVPAGIPHTQGNPG